LLQPAPVAHARHAPRQLSTRLGGLLHVAHVACRLLRGHGTHPGAARVGGGAHHVLCGLQPGQLALLAGPLRAPGQRQQAQHIKFQEAFDLDLAAFGEAADREMRVGQAPGLHALGIADAQRRHGGMQLRIVQQCNAHRGLGRDRLGQQRGHGLLRVGRGAARHCGVHTRRLAARELAHLAGAAVGRDAGAAGQQQGGRQYGPCNKACHGLCPPWCRWCPVVRDGVAGAGAARARSSSHLSRSTWPRRNWPTSALAFFQSAC
jgi:hypothetical protein